MIKPVLHAAEWCGGCEMENPSLATPRTEQFTKYCIHTILPGKKGFHKQQNSPGRI